MIFMLICSSYFLQAQITIDPYEIGPQPVDTFDYYYFTSTLPLPTTGANQVWDYSSMTSNFLFSAPFNPPPADVAAAVPSATTYRFWYQTDLTAYKEDTMLFATNAMGLTRPGVVDGAYTDNISFYTGGAQDQLSKVRTYSVFSTPEPWYLAPMNFGDSSFTVSKRTSKYILDAPSINYPNFQMERRRTVTTDIDVVGWGLLILQNPITTVVDTFEVLLQTRTRLARDTFVDVSGNLVPDSVLSLFSFTQGQITDGWEFFDMVAKGTGFSVLYWEMPYGNTNPSFSGISRKEFDRAYSVSTKAPQVNAVAHKVYPNPVTNHQFQLEIDKDMNETWKLNIYNFGGQLIHQEDVKSNNMQVNLGAGFTSGYYFYSVTNEQDEIKVTGKLTLLD